MTNGDDGNLTKGIPAPGNRLKRVVSMSGEFGLRNYTVRDLRELKNKRQLVQIMAFSPDEAMAAEVAGIDLINVRWDANDPEQAMEIRRAAPQTFMTFCLTPTLVAGKTEALRAAFNAMDAGADGIYCSWSISFIAALAEAGIPVQGHAGLVPRKSTWTGGLRAVGKTVEQARAIFDYFQDLEAAGAWAVECELIPHQLLSQLSKATSLITVSLGSGCGGDVQYLFAEDILGERPSSPPRHAKAYRNFSQLKKELQNERVSAFKEFAADVRGGDFPKPGNLVETDDLVIAEFAKQLKQS
jgi:3-methyl-2-oxobutanoate hydroxymethyltransferase